MRAQTHATAVFVRQADERSAVFGRHELGFIGRQLLFELNQTLDAISQFAFALDAEFTGGGSRKKTTVFVNWSRGFRTDSGLSREGLINGAVQLEASNNFHVRVGIRRSR